MDAMSENQVEKSRILVVDDHPLFREGLRQIIEPKFCLEIPHGPSTYRFLARKLETSKEPLPRRDENHDQLKLWITPLPCSATDVEWHSSRHPFRSTPQTPATPLSRPLPRTLLSGHQSRRRATSDRTIANPTPAQLPLRPRPSPAAKA